VSHYPPSYLVHTHNLADSRMQPRTKAPRGYSARRIDSDMKSFLASTNCSPAHPIEDLITLVPLVQTLQDDPSPISTRPLDMLDDWDTSFFKKWERVLKVNSFTDEGEKRFGRRHVAWERNSKRCSRTFLISSYILTHTLMVMSF
jgi:hypothetical protein